MLAVCQISNLFWEDTWHLECVDIAKNNIDSKKNYFFSYFSPICYVIPLQWSLSTALSTGDLGRVLSFLPGPTSLHADANQWALFRSHQALWQLLQVPAAVWECRSLCKCKLFLQKSLYFPMTGLFSPAHSDWPISWLATVIRRWVWFLQKLTLFQLWLPFSFVLFWEPPSVHTEHEETPAFKWMENFAATSDLVWMRP